MTERINIKYKRPERFTNRDRFTKRDLRELLATPDAELKWYNYTTIFGPFHHAGTYEESVYFLPLAFEFIRTHPEDSLELTSSLTWFISEFSGRLEEDGLLEHFREELMGNLWHWTSTFHVVHCDKAACQAKGWVLDYNDYVELEDPVGHTLMDFDFYKIHGDLADLFISQLGASEQIHHAAWLLNLAYRADWPYHWPERPGIMGILKDKKLLSEKFSIVKNSDLFKATPASYWDDLIEKLEI